MTKIFKDFITEFSSQSEPTELIESETQDLDFFECMSLYLNKILLSINTTFCCLPVSRLSPWPITTLPVKLNRKWNCQITAILDYFLCTHHDFWVSFVYRLPVSWHSPWHSCHIFISKACESYLFNCLYSLYSINPFYDWSWFLIFLFRWVSALIVTFDCFGAGWQERTYPVEYVHESSWKWLMLKLHTQGWWKFMNKNIHENRFIFIKFH